MLFNSIAFIAVFLPLTLAATWLAQRIDSGVTLRNAVLLVASFVFYGYWDVRFVPLLAGSILWNYLASILIARGYYPGTVAAATIAVNILWIGVFKYLLFFAGMLAPADQLPAFIRNIVLPIGISFFTFHQIAYIVDIYKGRVPTTRLLEYALFANFFPQLIAGPVVRFQQIEPQLRSAAARIGPYFAVGVFLFSVGLFKKVVLADNLAPVADRVFSWAEAGRPLGTIDAWIGALSYTYQLYFDFSGYTDMALGLGLMFGFRLPMNFDSPYKATSIIDFWRRWHITLSSFFRDYLYIPLGGNRHGLARQIAILLFVMALVGLWHGAGWTFIIWGVYHGVLLSAAHLLTAAWPALRHHGFLPAWLDGKWGKAATKALLWSVTFILVVIGWVIFRAESWGGAMKVLTGMISLSSTSEILRAMPGYYAAYCAAAGLILVSTLICLLLPNACRVAGMTVEGMGFSDRRQDPAPQDLRLPDWLQPARGMSYRLAAGVAVLFYIATASLFTASTKFIYFQF